MPVLKQVKGLMTFSATALFNCKMQPSTASSVKLAHGGVEGNLDVRDRLQLSSVIIDILTAT